MSVPAPLQHQMVGFDADVTRLATLSRILSPSSNLSNEIVTGILVLVTLLLLH